MNPEVVFLLDVDNTLLDNDRIIEDLRRHLEREFGVASADRYWAIFEALRSESRLRRRLPRRPAALSDVHKEQMLDAVQRHYPARRYVMVDDKQRILTAMKGVLQERLVTVFPRQGHYAVDPVNIARYPTADITVEHIGDLLDLDVAKLSGASATEKA